MASRGHHPPRWYDLFTKADFDRNHFACVVIGNYVVVAGGVFSWLEEPPLDEFGDFDDLDQRMNSVAVFDLASKKFITHTIPDLPFLGECDGAVLNDYFYVFSNGEGEAYRFFLGPDQS